MDKHMTIRGLPHGLAMDGWWLEDPDPGRGHDTVKNATGLGRQMLPILLLVALGDALFWGHPVGMSAALFAFALFALAHRGRPFNQWWRPAMLLLVAALPVLDHVQALSLAFLVTGLVAALVWSHHPHGTIVALTRLSLRFLRRLPLRWLALLNPRVALKWLSVTKSAGEHASPWRQILRNWAFPIGGGLAFLSLLLDANPVLAQLVAFDLDLGLSVQRPLFWLGLAILVTPFLGPMPAAEMELRCRPTALRLPGIGINPGSVLRALVLFNLLIGAQSMADLSILLGGAQLPAGMTLAEYAHRGAYPLLAAAILAGAFALAARTFLHEHRLIKPLLLLWLVQNMLLCAAAALRLKLYIDAFGLTYLRLDALIWMALVAVGLGMVIWQVLRARSNGWLLGRVAVLGFGTLYLCSFVNFAQVIAGYNVTHGFADDVYLCELGPLAAGPIVEGGAGVKRGSLIWLDYCRMDAPSVGNWREWGFRTWAVGRYVRQVTTAEAPE